MREYGHDKMYGEIDDWEFVRDDAWYIKGYTFVSFYSIILIDVIYWVYIVYKRSWRNNLFRSHFSKNWAQTWRIRASRFLVLFYSGTLTSVYLRSSAAFQLCKILLRHTLGWWSLSGSTDSPRSMLLQSGLVLAEQSWLSEVAPGASLEMWSSVSSALTEIWCFAISGRPVGCRWTHRQRIGSLRANLWWSRRGFQEHANAYRCSLPSTCRGPAALLA